MQFEPRARKKEQISAATRERRTERFTHVCHVCARMHARTHTRGRGYKPAGPCLYGTFSGSQAAVGTINDNLSLALRPRRVQRIGTDRPPFPSLFLPFSLFLFLPAASYIRERGRRRTMQRNEDGKYQRSLSIKIDAREA